MQDPFCSTVLIAFSRVEGGSGDETSISAAQKELSVQIRNIYTCRLHDTSTYIGYSVVFM